MNALRLEVIGEPDLLIDFDLTTSLAFFARQIAVTMRRASSASTAR